MAGRQDNGSGPGGRIQWPTLIAWLAVPLILVLAVYGCATSAGGLSSTATQIPYSEFRAQLEAGNITSIVAQGDQIQGTLKTPAQTSAGQSGPVQYTTFTTLRPPFGDPALFDLLAQNNVQIEAVSASTGSTLSSALVILVPLLLLVAVGFAFARSMRGQGGATLSDFGRSGAKVYHKEAASATTSASRR